ncbi:hypothetical protein [Methylobacterium oxalidis]|uniref:Uncharacterized protein n=1 Tax=Methylobacterium oxalidis TaxID=944322 RepID=A0A512J9D4_9HYPH|nr:hypothetical protein [Methylobacterium oxalidis]GEP06563.1 hypothetical protein MOX02_46010 [Methylobacterium oxalidis]GJE33759.1 hypothetical protein LDDCCGHA_3962 [Methylobacterium oxalidis]GLS63859.1 hypothetical protein GCM10007888_22400 [Methylobacterium oxalidis]
MATNTQGLSDKALSIFTFAAYHRLLSGERVTSVVRRDGHGHEADPDGVAELERRGLATASETQISLGDEAEAFVDTLVDAIRREGGA